MDREETMESGESRPEPMLGRATVLSGDAATACYYRVVAMDKDGHDMQSSDTLHLSAPGCD